MTQTEALSILKTGANVFLTGEPGSGKTHTVNAYVAYLREHGIEPSVTASTGIAATHLGGFTIHSWSGIGVKRFLSAYDLENIASREYVVKRMRRTKILIIDEVSMLGPETLDMVDAVCREVRGNSEPFGGLQVVFVGDFFQLPPVSSSIRNDVSDGLFSDEKPPRFAYESGAWKRAHVVTCYLSEQYRQDDDRFLSVLSAIRKNTFGPEHRAHIEERMWKRSEKEYDMPKLFAHNVDVDRVNNDMLDKISGEAHMFPMKDRGKSALVEALKKGCLSPVELKLKKGARVMFTKNDQNGAYVNGTLGEVVDFDAFSEYPIVLTKDGTRVTTELAEWSVVEDGKMLASLEQIPLRLAWAITVHKSQGMSMDEAVMDLSQIFEYGQGYVALSRVRRLSGLYLLGYNERAFQVHPDVLADDEHFRIASEEAQEGFAALSQEELKSMYENFILASGGVLEKKKAETKKEKIKNEKHKKKKEKDGDEKTLHRDKSRSGESDWNERLAKLRETYPNAYRPWKSEDDIELINLFKKGKSLEELPPIFGRQPGSIRARLEMHGLIEPDPAYQKKE
ncbi:MAG: AAA family ATPase [Candidatus Yonathbacteria bacterium]|nr:AAA family ATPase [Candidatus Yonathbacteria bacterium]